MKPITPNEIEALRRRWREILKRAQEKGEHPSPVDIEEANASNDPIVAQLVAETTKALKEHSKSRLGRLNTNPKDFQPAKRNDSSALKLVVAAETLTSRRQKYKR